jgi:hypothetical protein
VVHGVTLNAWEALRFLAGCKSGTVGLLEQFIKGDMGFAAALEQMGLGILGSTQEATPGQLFGLWLRFPPCVLVLLDSLKAGGTSKPKANSKPKATRQKKGAKQTPTGPCDCPACAAGAPPQPYPSSGACSHSCAQVCTTPFSHAPTVHVHMHLHLITHQPALDLTVCPCPYTSQFAIQHAMDTSGGQADAQLSSNYGRLALAYRQACEEHLRRRTGLCGCAGVCQAPCRPSVRPALRAPRSALHPARSTLRA